MPLARKLKNESDRTASDQRPTAKTYAMLRADDAPAVSPQKKRGQKIVRAELFFLDRGPFIRC